MKTWTTQAEARLTEYLAERARREGLEGEDAIELKDDLKRHIHEEAEREESSTISLMLLEQILGRLDAGYRPVESVKPHVARKVAGGFARFVQWTFGVVLPLAILIFESLTAFCGGVFFDPVPTWWHRVLVALVPLVNGWFLLGAKRGSDRTRGIAAGAALVVAIFYGLLFLPLAHLSLLAVIFLGMGFLSLTPIFAALVTWRIGKRAKQAAEASTLFQKNWRIGVGAALVAFALLEGPSFWTRSHLIDAQQTGDGGKRAIERLRGFHSERALLRACYEGNRGTSMATDIAGWVFRGWQFPAMLIGVNSQWGEMDSDRTRDVFFRVTGKPFNSVKPPRMVRESRMGRNADVYSDVEFDEHTGGDEVAVRLKHLDLADSRMDVHLDSTSRLGYGEWTMVFRNGARDAREARCQVRLPRGGHVSRLTLWINGEPREAAFNSVAKVKAAYREIAVVQRRDPVLVTMVGPDTVMVQCFPVPASGEMKIRFGVTAPFDGDRWELPKIIEQNFGTRDGIEHALWVQGNRQFEFVDGSAFTPSHKDGEGQSFVAGLPIQSAFSGITAARMEHLQNEEPTVWCEDRFAKTGERILVRKEVPAKAPEPATVIVVIDGSSALAGEKQWIGDVLRKQPPGTYTVLLADDGVRTVGGGLKELEEYSFRGGRDNESALREAVRLAKNHENAAIVWLHGPQAVKLTQPEALLQMLQRGTNHPVIYAIEAAQGPNRLAEALYQGGAVRRGPGLIDKRTELDTFLGGLLAPRSSTTWEWTRLADTQGLEGKAVWDQLARAWAAEKVAGANPAEPERELGALAARYQLVTPLSGAVVLETAEQYAQHGLEPVDPNATPAIPNVPEPSTVLLVIMGTTLAVFRRQREAA